MGIQTADLEGRNQLLYQLATTLNSLGIYCHNHCLRF